MFRLKDSAGGKSKDENIQALETYRIHPEHVKVVEIIEKICSERRVADYEV